MLSSDRPGFQRQTYGARRPNSGGTVLTLTPGQKMSALNLIMSPQIVISGKVLDSDGDPVARTQVRALRYMFYNGKRQIMPMGYAATDEAGDYKIQNLDPGKFFISASPPHEGGFFGQGSRTAAPRPPAGQPVKQEEAAVTIFYPGATDVTAATMIELVAGHDWPATDITLRKLPVYHVRGKVTGQVPTDRAQLRVSVLTRSSVFMDFGGASSHIGPDGAFDIPLVSPGAYKVMLVSVIGNFKVLGAVPVDVGSHDVENLVVTAEPPFDLNGQVKVEKPANSANDPAKANKTPWAPTRLSLMPVEGPAMNVPNASTKDDDTFSLVSVSPGRFRVSVFSMADGFYLKEVRFGDQDVLRNGLTIAPGGGSTPWEITLGANAAKLDGSVQTAEGKPAPPTIVTLIPDPPAPDRTDLHKQGNTD